MNQPWSYMYSLSRSPLPTRSLWVFPVHQARALVSCIPPGLVICFTLDNIHASMLFSWNIFRSRLVLLKLTQLNYLVMITNWYSIKQQYCWSKNWCVLCVLKHSVVSDSLQSSGPWPTRLLCPRGFSRQEYWSGLPCPPPGHLADPGIKPRFPTSQVDSLPSEPPGQPHGLKRNNFANIEQKGRVPKSFISSFLINVTILKNLSFGRNNLKWESCMLKFSLQAMLLSFLQKWWGMICLLQSRQNIWNSSLIYSSCINQVAAAYLLCAEHENLLFLCIFNLNHQKMWCSHRILLSWPRYLLECIINAM